MYHQIALGARMLPIAVIAATDSSLPCDLIVHYQGHLVPMATHFCQDSYKAVVDLDHTNRFRRIDRDGKLDLLERVRTQKYAWSRVNELSAIQAKTRKFEKMGILHVNAPKMARDFMDVLQNTLPCPAEIKLVEVTPGLSVLSGAGMVGTVFVVK